MVAARLGCRSLSWHWVGKLSPWLHVENATLTLNVVHSWLFRLWTGVCCRKCKLVNEWAWLKSLVCCDWSAFGFSFGVRVPVEMKIWKYFQHAYAEKPQVKEIRGELNYRFPAIMWLMVKSSSRYTFLSLLQIILLQICRITACIQTYLCNPFHQYPTENLLDIHK